MPETIKVLCLDDNRGVRKSLESVFNYGVLLPCTATIVEFGSEAISLIKSVRYDLVILDNELDGQSISGVEVATESISRGMKTIINTANPYGVIAPEGVEVRQKMTLFQIEEVLEEVLRTRKSLPN